LLAPPSELSRQAMQTGNNTTPVEEYPTIYAGVRPNSWRDPAWYKKQPNWINDIHAPHPLLTEPLAV